MEGRGRTGIEVGGNGNRNAGRDQASRGRNGTPDKQRSDRERDGDRTRSRKPRDAIR